MDTISLKRYILDNNKCELVLSSIGCHNIEYSKTKEYIYAAMPDGDNPKGVVIYLVPYLNYASFSRDIQFEESKDIIDLVQAITKKSFVASIKYLHEVLGLEYTPYKKEESKEKKFDPLAPFKKILNRVPKIDVAEIQYLNEELINDYIPLLHIDWFREGVMPWTRDRFGLAYSYKHKRVVIPLRHWATGDLLGFNMRTTVENYDEFGIRKYFITPHYQKNLNLYGLYENKEEIEENKYCVVYESEKSVLKRHSRGDGTSVALQGKTMSQEQRRILLGLDVNEIIIALDKDVSIEEVRYICEQIYSVNRFRNKKVSYIYDDEYLLGDKDSPADADNDTYKTLFDNRVVYDLNEHIEYEKSLKK